MVVDQKTKLRERIMGSTICMLNLGEIYVAFAAEIEYTK
jgi:hypothetical protein